MEFTPIDPHQHKMLLLFYVVTVVPQSMGPLGWLCVMTVSN
uniref:Nmd3p n=1 Tax=Saccharomyces cerevisiae TaxID=4932 RepID=E9P9Z7_YEASX|nr:Nmd3p [Saccharomyces cerevisiae]